MLKIISNRVLHDNVLQITALIFIISCFLGWPLFSSINWDTIMSLAMLMLTVQLAVHFKLLDYFTQLLLKRVNNQRQLVQLIMFLAFFSAMLLTNDVAILTLVPIYLKLAHDHAVPIPLPLTLITIAANLGSMTMPFGNPQNLYLVANYHWSLLNFMTVALPFAVISLLLLTGATRCVHPKYLANVQSKSINIKSSSIFIISGLLIINILGIFNFIPLPLTLLITIVAVGISNYHTYEQVDYGLLLTFVFFFLIVGNLSQNHSLIHLIINLTTSKLKVYLMGIGISQLISNVPAVILLSKFTRNVSALFLGVNIGGLGTLVASLANLITLKQLINDKSRFVKKFIETFLFINLIGLIIMGILGWIFLIFFEK